MSNVRKYLYDMSCKTICLYIEVVFFSCINNCKLRAFKFQLKLLISTLPAVTV